MVPGLDEDRARKRWCGSAPAVDGDGGFRVVYGEEEGDDVGARLDELLGGGCEAFFFFGRADGGRAVDAEGEKLGGVAVAAAGELEAAEVARDGAPPGEVPGGAEGIGGFVEIS